MKSTKKQIIVDQVENAIRRAIGEFRGTTLETDGISMSTVRRAVNGMGLKCSVDGCGNVYASSRK